jgi:outer membrane protein OmpA-like peptidoglycan-associated protein
MSCVSRPLGLRHHRRWLALCLLLPAPSAIPVVLPHAPPSVSRSGERPRHRPLRLLKHTARAPNRIKRPFFFERNAITISREDAAALREIADVLRREFPTSVFLIRGYADMGEFRRNEQLPEQRARAIASELHRMCIASEQLRTEGEKPVFAGSESERRQLTSVDTLRRAELYRTGNHVRAPGATSPAATDARHAAGACAAK